MRILFVSPEAVPYSKSGGLADVAGALPEKLSGSEDVTLITPLYKNSAYDTSGLKKVNEFKVGISDDELNCTIYEGEKKKNFRTLLISNDLFFAREFIYGSNEREYHDNFFRYLFFQNSVIQFIIDEGKGYDIIHLNDWQTSLIPALIKENGSSVLKKTSTVLTIHNLGYQGLFEHYYFKDTGLPGYYFTPESFEFFGKINSLKGGIIHSDRVVTVSPNYAGEIQTREFGAGLDGVLTHHSKKVSGILNGADYDVWDPEKDPFIYQKYSAENFKRKIENKTGLFREFNIPFKKETPLAIAVTRLASQKGIELLLESINDLKGRDINFIILGTGEKKLETELGKMSRNNPGLIFFKKFDEKLSHKLYAAGDIFVMPSLYEPCGLSQLYALRYGTVPVVSSTGGLDDTVDIIKGKRGTGFKLREKTSIALSSTLLEAAELFKLPSDWEKTARRGMGKDFSWNKPGKEYLKIYKQLFKEK
ncbi:MAG: glycogen/starch synthase [Acidobacteriota bacterium]